MLFGRSSGNGSSDGGGVNRTTAEVAAFEKWFAGMVRRSDEANKGMPAGKHRIVSEDYEGTPAVWRHIRDKYDIVNRDRRPKKVATARKVIRAGKFKHTHQGIAFSFHPTLKAWVLSDGGHRNCALDEENATATLHFSFGQPFDNFDSFDTNVAVRNKADALHAKGKKNAKELGQICELFLTIENGQPGRGSFTPGEVLEFEPTYPCIEQSVADAKSIATKLGGDGTTAAVGVALSLILLHSKHRDRWTAFKAALMSGAELNQHSPILYLREAIRENRFDYKGGEHAAQVCSEIIRVWNLWVRGKRIIKNKDGRPLIWMVGERFPKPE